MPSYTRVCRVSKKPGRWTLSKSATYLQGSVATGFSCGLVTTLLEIYLLLTVTVERIIYKYGKITASIE